MHNALETSPEHNLFAALPPSHQQLAGMARCFLPLPSHPTRFGVEERLAI